MRIKIDNQTNNLYLESVKYYGEKCQECGATKSLDMHYIKPLIDGGSKIVENVCLLCKDCSQKYEEGNFQEEHLTRSTWNKIHILRYACSHQNEILCDYTDSKGVKEKRHVRTSKITEIKNPKEDLLIIEPRLYLYCFDPTGRMKKFRISRVENIELLTIKSKY